MCYGNVTRNRKHKVYKTIGRTTEDIKKYRMYFKISNWKRRIWTDRENYQDEWRIHQVFTPTKEIQKIQYLETQSPNITQRDKLKRKWKETTN